MLHASSTSETRRAGRGQALIEFAIVLPAFLLILVAALDFGRVFYLYLGVTNAAREGAAYAVNNAADTSGITAHAQQELGNDTNLTVTATCSSLPGCPSCGAQLVTGDCFTVTAKEQFTFLTPLIQRVVGTPFWVSSSSTAGTP